jgi:hypothetical protein
MVLMQTSGIALAPAQGRAIAHTHEEAARQAWAWGRVHSGLGWVAVGLVLGLIVLFVEYLPALLRFVGIEAAPLNDDEMWAQDWTIARTLRRTVVLLLLCYAMCMGLGLLRCLLAPSRDEAGSFLAWVASTLFLVWALGRIGGLVVSMANPWALLPEQHEEVLKMLALFQQAVFVMFLREVGRDSGEKAFSLVGLPWIFIVVVASVFMVSLAQEYNLAGAGTSLAMRPVRGAGHQALWFAVLGVLQVLLVHLVLAARQAAGRLAGAVPSLSRDKSV